MLRTKLLHCNAKIKYPISYALQIVLSNPDPVLFIAKLPLMTSGTTDILLIILYVLLLCILLFLVSVAVIEAVNLLTPRPDAAHIPVSTFGRAGICFHHAGVAG